MAAKKANLEEQNYTEEVIEDNLSKLDAVSNEDFKINYEELPSIYEYGMRCYKYM